MHYISFGKFCRDRHVVPDWIDAIQENDNYRFYYTHIKHGKLFYSSVLLRRVFPFEQEAMADSNFVERYQEKDHWYCDLLGSPTTDMKFLE